jgi:hypothetical protein
MTTFLDPTCKACQMGFPNPCHNHVEPAPDQAKSTPQTPDIVAYGLIMHVTGAEDDPHWWFRHDEGKTREQVEERARELNDREAEYKAKFPQEYAERGNRIFTPVKVTLHVEPIA